MIPLQLVSSASLESALAADPWLKTTDFKAKPHSFCLVPTPEGDLKKVVVGVEEPLNIWTLGSLPRQLPLGTYFLQGDYTPEQATNLALAWHLGAYHFSRYVQKPQQFPTLHLPKQADPAFVEAATRAIFLSRDLINTPANDMMPADLAGIASTLANTYHASLTVTNTPATLEKEWPLIWAVGKGSANLPCLIDLQWGNTAHPKITLVGKGVCFDSGGLDIKPASAMQLMKKDMGGAAIVLGLAQLIMALNVPVCLRVLIPAVENSVSGTAFRPLDVIKSRKGLTIEIGDTDAEGRLILADVLHEAAQESPALLLDFATLTGAARVALGAEIPAFFSNNDAIAATLTQTSAQTTDPLWRLPLYAPYKSGLNSKIADLNNIASGSYGGAITAALFLEEFVPKTVPWVHIDCMAWNQSTQAGRPEGGEAMGLRAVFSLIQQTIVK